MDIPLAFPLQYYEMSYGLNVEMHKQVTVLGIKVCSRELWEG